MARYNQWDLNAGFDEGVKRSIADITVASKLFDDNQAKLARAYALDKTALTFESEVDAINAGNEFKTENYDLGREYLPQVYEERSARHGYNINLFDAKNQDLIAGQEAIEAVANAPRHELSQDENGNVIEGRQLTEYERLYQASQNNQLSPRARMRLGEMARKEGVSEAFGRAALDPAGTMNDAVKRGFIPNGYAMAPSGDGNYSITIPGIGPKTFSAEAATSLTRDLIAKTQTFDGVRRQERLEAERRKQEAARLLFLEKQADERRKNIELQGRNQLANTILQNTLRGGGSVSAGRQGGAPLPQAPLFDPIARRGSTQPTSPTATSGLDMTQIDTRFGGVPPEQLPRAEGDSPIITGQDNTAQQKPPGYDDLSITGKLALDFVNEQDPVNKSAIVELFKEKFGARTITPEMLERIGMQERAKLQNRSQPQTASPADEKQRLLEEAKARIARRYGL